MGDHAALTADKICDMLLNICLVFAVGWEKLKRNSKAVGDDGHRHWTKVKLILENDHLAQGGAGLGADEFKIKLCQICERAGADWVKNSTGYGFIQQHDGSYDYKGTTERDTALIRLSCWARCQATPDGVVHGPEGCDNGGCLAGPASSLVD